jgi:hypothetical protein
MIINGTGRYQGPGGFDRGMQTTIYCGNNPESWIRASATLETSTGDLSITVQLETDSTRAGPKGLVNLYVKDAAGNVLASAQTAELATGGKPPGRAVIRNYSSHASVPVAVAAQAASLYLQAECTGSATALFGIDGGSANNAFNIAVNVLVAIAGGGSSGA